MHCKFLTNGIAVDYSQLVRPCCTYQADNEWHDKNKFGTLSLVNWHNSAELENLKKQLANDQWPSGCNYCKQIESQGRGDSMRLNAESAYGHYNDQDITLEIRPGSVCNFACQTCWPEASSRVREYYRRAGFKNIVKWSDRSTDIILDETRHIGLGNFESLDVIKHRLRDIVLLGGEPFYDPECKQFLEWCKKSQINSNLMIFTNGSQIDFEWIDQYPGKITLIFSLDAIGNPAEYIRYGTNWPQVESNYLRARANKKINCRVNITTSIFNYWYLSDLIEWLAEDWPEVVSFGLASTVNNSYWMDETVIPLSFRKNLITKLQTTVEFLETCNIEKYQKINAQSALRSIAENLDQQPWNPEHFSKFKHFVDQMDQVKNIRLQDHCARLAEMINHSG